MSAYSADTHNVYNSNSHVQTEKQEPVEEYKKYNLQNINYSQILAV